MGDKGVRSRDQKKYSPPVWNCKLVSTLFLPSMDSENVGFSRVQRTVVCKFRFSKATSYAYTGEEKIAAAAETVHCFCCLRGSAVLSTCHAPVLHG